MVSNNSVKNTVQDNDFSVNREEAGTTVQSSVDHSDDTSGTSNAKLFSKVGGTFGGDPHVNFNVSGTQDYSMGIDNSDSDNLKITNGSDPSSGGIYITCDQASTNIFLNGLSFDAGTTVMQDYLEDVSWTPSLEFGGGVTGITYLSPPAGLYMRIGNLVVLRADFTLTSKGSDTGTALITGFPLGTVAGGFATMAVQYGDMVLMGGRQGIFANIGSGGTITINSSGSGVSINALDDTNFTNTSSFAWSGSFLTT